MLELMGLLDAYRNGAPYPTYETLQKIAQHHKLSALEELLTRYREGGLFPSYRELAVLAYA